MRTLGGLLAAAAVAGLLAGCSTPSPAGPQAKPEGDIDTLHA